MQLIEICRVNSYVSGTGAFTGITTEISIDINNTSNASVLYNLIAESDLDPGYFLPRANHHLFLQ